MEPKKLGRLVLTLRLDEEVFIGPDISVAVVQTKGKQIRLAIKAPKETQIDRNRFKRENDHDSRGNR